MKAFARIPLLLLPVISRFSADLSALQNVYNRRRMQFGPEADAPVELSSKTSPQRVSCLGTVVRLRVMYDALPWVRSSSRQLNMVLGCV